jgi:hypothetical protein
MYCICVFFNEFVNHLITIYRSIVSPRIWASAKKLAESLAVELNPKSCDGRPIFVNLVAPLWLSFLGFLVLTWLNFHEPSLAQVQKIYQGTKKYVGVKHTHVRSCPTTVKYLLGDAWRICVINAVRRWAADWELKFWSGVNLKARLRRALFRCVSYGLCPEMVLSPNQWRGPVKSKASIWPHTSSKLAMVSSSHRCCCWTGNAAITINITGMHSPTLHWNTWTMWFLA